MNDKDLLETYMKGFNDELRNKKYITTTDNMLDRAYELGRTHAIIGDDISSFDNQSDDEILAQIKQL